jgi:hypothetical protein
MNTKPGVPKLGRRKQKDPEFDTRSCLKTPVVGGQW